MKIIADRLKWIREEKYGPRGMTDFARAIEISPSGYLNYEKGRRPIPSDVLTRIRECTSVNLQWFLTGEGEPYSNQEATKRLTSEMHKAIGHPSTENLSSNGQIAIEAVHHQKFTDDYWPSLKPYVENEDIHLWLIGSEDGPPPIAQVFENRLVHLSRSSQKDNRVIANLSADAVIFPSYDITQRDTLTDWTGRIRLIFLELMACTEMEVIDHFKRRKQVSSLPLQWIAPYFISSYPFYQNADCLLDRIGGHINQVQIAWLDSRSTNTLASSTFQPNIFDESLLHALSLLTLVGSTKGAKIHSVNLVDGAGQENPHAEISLTLTTYMRNRIEVCLRIGAKNRHKAERCFELRGASTDGCSLQIDFRNHWISLVEKYQRPLYLMPLVHNPYRFLFSQLISGDYAQNPCGLSFQAGLEILQLYSKVKAEISSQLATAKIVGDGKVALDSPQVLSAEPPLVRSVPALIHSLPLTESDRDQLLSLIESQVAGSNRFQSILSPAHVESLGDSIETEAIGTVEDIPHLLKHSLIRATIGTTIARLTPTIIHPVAQEDPASALKYVRSIPDSLLSRKLAAYYAVIGRLLEQARRDESLEIVEEALSVVRGHDDLFETMRNLPAIATWYATCHQMDKARQIATEAHDMLTPRAASPELIAKFYRQLAEMEAEIGRLDRADQLLNQSLALGTEALTDPTAINVHLSRSAVQYTHLSLRYFEQCLLSETDRSIKQAEQLIEQIKDPWHQIEALSEQIFISYKYFQNFTHIRSVLSRAIDIARQISDPSDQSRAFSYIVKAITECIAIGIGDDNDLDLAEEIANQISEPAAASSALLNIAYTHVHRNHLEQARSFLDQVLKLAEKTKNTEGRTDILKHIAGGLIEDERIHLAIEIAQLKIPEADKLIPLLRLARAIAEAGEVDLAKQKLESIVEVAQRIPAALAKLSAFVQIAIVHWAIEESESAHHFIAEAEKLSLRLTGQKEKMLALLSLTLFYAHIHDQQKAEEQITEAEAIARTIRDPAEALSHVACAWAKAGHPNKALAIVEQEIQEEGPKEQAIAQVTIALSQSRHLKNALTLISQVNFLPDRAILLAHNASALAESGDIDAAQDTIEQAIHASAQICQPNNKAEVYAAIAAACTKVGDSGQALHFLQMALRNASYSTRDNAIEVIENLIPVVTHLGDVQLLSDVYAELQRADEIFNN